MKTLLFLVFSAFLFCRAQQTAEPLTYSDVVKVDSAVKKDQLFASARTWLLDEFKSLKDVSQITDKENEEN